MAEEGPKSYRERERYLEKDRQRSTGPFYHRPPKSRRRSSWGFVAVRCFERRLATTGCARDNWRTPIANPRGKVEHRSRYSVAGAYLFAGNTRKNRHRLGRS